MKKEGRGVRKIEMRIEGDMFMINNLIKTKRYLISNLNSLESVFNRIVYVLAKIAVECST